MYLKLLKNDFKKNPISNLILLLFMSLSVIIAVTVALRANRVIYLEDGKIKDTFSQSKSRENNLTMSVKNLKERLAKMEF